MECKWWDERGLLYEANELDAQQTSEFKKHLDNCVICQNEIRLYSDQKEALFKREFFEQETSEELDRIIIKECSQQIKSRRISFFMLPLFIKKAIYATVILSIGFGGGAYFSSVKLAIASKKIDNNSTTKVAEFNSIESTQNKKMQGNSIVDISGNKSDSIKPIDSLFDPKKQIPSQGVYQVNLGDE